MTRQRMLTLAANLAAFLAVHALVAGESAKPMESPADSWTMFRGNLRMTGVSAASLPDKLELLWKVETGEPIEATAAIFENVVYFATLDGTFYAVSLADGKELWKFANPEKDAIKSSPCIAGNLVCYGDEFGTLRALDRATGEVKWKVSTDAEIISSPIFIDGKVIVGSYDESLYCVRAEDGQVEWKLQTMGPVHCSPSYIDGQVVVAGCDGFLRLASVNEGKEAAALEIGGNIVSTPAIIGKRLFVGTNSNTVVRADLVDKTLTQEWVFTPKRQFPFFSSPAVTADLCIIGGRDKEVHAIDQSTGKERWSFRTRARVDSSPVIAGDRVFVGSSDGNVYGLDVQTGKKVWEYLTGAPIVAGPAVAAGRLVVGDDNGNVYCFGGK